MSRLKDFIIGAVILIIGMASFSLVFYVLMKILWFIIPLLVSVIGSNKLFVNVLTVTIILVLIVCVYQFIKSTFMLCLCVGEEMRKLRSNRKR